MAKTASKGENKNLHSLYKPLTVNQLSVEKFQRKKRGPARLWPPLSTDKCRLDQVHETVLIVPAFAYPLFRLLN